MGNMEFGIELMPNLRVHELEYYARLSEESGFRYLWVTDHYNNRNAFVVLSALARCTSNIKVGVGITNPFHMNPAVISSAIATIDEMSGGRAVLGIGAGDLFTLRSIGIERRKPLKRVGEAIYIIRKLLNGETVNFDGEIFKFRGAKLSFKSRCVPIYVGAQRERMVRLASDIGDGLILNASHPKDVEFALKNVELREGFDFAVCSSFSIDKSRERAIQNAKVVVAFIVSSSPPEVLERHGIDYESVRSVSLALRDAFESGNWRCVVDVVSDEMVEEFSISGTIDDVIERIESLEKLGVTQIVVGSPIGREKSKVIRMIGDQIIPHFQKGD